jgi:hypothetical protein
MKYFAITLLLVVISLTNSAVIIQFEANSYKFGSIEINIHEHKNDPYAESFEIRKGNVKREFYFGKNNLVKRLEIQNCLASKNEYGHTIYKIDLIHGTKVCEEKKGYDNVDHKDPESMFGYCCFKQFGYMVEAEDGRAHVIAVKCNFFIN